ncbi:hypothetical protein [Halocatena salina]|uniref:Uncharacterized protein n=1 Tax=Halocatena salina TaxID=2934340 RepID=A0A8T9ZYK5_9EURY|nr:hypothetical protein [Halocatena salina]UPM41760.1 hypothetical protein MW046_07100 [Halocatena salina]
MEPERSVLSGRASENTVPVDGVNDERYRPNCRRSGSFFRLLFVRFGEAVA